MTAVSVATEMPLRFAYVDAMSGLPGGVTVVTAVDRHGRPAGMTTTSAVSVSADPPMISVAMAASARTLAAVQDGGGFCVNILHPCGRDAALVFASRTEDKFRDIPWEAGPAGLPWLPSFTSHALHCDVSAQVTAGDHVLLVGQVTSVSIGRPDPGEAGRGLVYWRRRWLEVTQ